MRLRPLAEADLPKRLTWVLDGGTQKLMGVRQPETGATLEDLKEWYRARLEAGDSLFAVEADGRLVGEIEVYPEKGYADMTLMIGDPSDRRRGIGSEAVRQALAWVFETARAACVEVDVAPGNSAAHRFWLKHGFRTARTDEHGTIYLRLAREDYGT